MAMTNDNANGNEYSLFNQDTVASVETGETQQTPDLPPAPPHD
jgi:hypothetical protein